MKLERTLWLMAGIFLGSAIGDALWYLRLSQERPLREMILYLQKGDLNIFIGMGLMSFVFFIITYLIILYVGGAFTRGISKKDDAIEVASE